MRRIRHKWENNNLYLGLIRLDAVDSEAALDVVEKTEVLIGLGDGDGV